MSGKGASQDAPFYCGWNDNLHNDGFRRFLLTLCYKLHIIESIYYGLRWQVSIMATKKQEQYGNSSISMLKGEERVRKRPAVIFGSDDLEGYKHAVFEILSNAIDEAREGHGDTIIVTRYEDLSVEVEDFGRGCPVDYNEKEKRYNWELVFCEMYAGGKYGENGENYEYSLGLNGLGSCATQYASEFFDATIRRDGFRYDLHFE